MLSTQCWTPNTKWKLFWNISLRTWAAIFTRKAPFFELVIFPFFWGPNPYTRMCVSTTGSFSFFREKMKHMVNYKSGLGLGGFLWFSISLFFLIIYKGNRFGTPPPRPCRVRHGSMHSRCTTLMYIPKLQTRPVNTPVTADSHQAPCMHYVQKACKAKCQPKKIPPILLCYAVLWPLLNMSFGCTSNVWFCVGSISPRIKEKTMATIIAGL